LTFGVPVIPTFHVPLCVAATGPEMVVEPVTGSGMGASMVTFGPPPWADACLEFIIVPITATPLLLSDGSCIASSSRSLAKSSGRLHGRICRALEDFD
jgi:hypothetical protein